MIYIDPETENILELIGVNTTTATYSVREAIDQFDAGKTTTVLDQNMPIEEYHHIFFRYLQSTGKYENYIRFDHWTSWPASSKLPEYNANYRIFVTIKQVADIVSTKYKSMITDIRPEYIKDTSTGKYVYLDQFNEGDPYIIKNILNLEIEKNPYKEVPDINYDELPKP